MALLMNRSARGETTIHVPVGGHISVLCDCRKTNPPHSIPSNCKKSPTFQMYQP